MKLKTDATKMLTALTPVLCTLEGTKDDAGFKKVPKQLQSKFLATLKSLQEMRDGCHDAIAKRTTDPLWFNIDDVKESVKKGSLPQRATHPLDPLPTLMTHDQLSGIVKAPGLQARPSKIQKVDIRVGCTRRGWGL